MNTPINPSVKAFNIRVYGLLLNAEKQVLVSAENYFGKRFTKFPGGGLEFGEGIANCLVREFKEELNLAVRVKKHLYTTDFFIASAFNPAQQLISVYFSVEPIDALNQIPCIIGVPSPPVEENTQNFGWVPLKELSPEIFTFPIDKHLIEKLNHGDITL
ncbi:MAG: NUDIX hydrolase [Luteibaculaceae bacterium]